MKWLITLLAIAIALYVFDAPTWAALIVGLITILLCDMAVNKYDKSTTHYHDEP